MRQDPNKPSWRNPSHLPDEHHANVVHLTPRYQPLQLDTAWPTIELEARVMAEPEYHVPLIRVLSPLNPAPEYGPRQVLEDGLMIVVGLGMTLGIPLLWWEWTH